MSEPTPRIDPISPDASTRSVFRVRKAPAAQCRLQSQMAEIVRYLLENDPEIQAHEFQYDSISYRLDLKRTNFNCRFSLYYWSGESLQQVTTETVETAKSQFTRPLVITKASDAMWSALQRHSKQIKAEAKKAATEGIAPTRIHARTIAAAQPA